ncbi:MAG: TfoX/Sxy family protein [Gammaproteobacteria bacterium]|nr:TfoX/Sxy family protein [Gammaproteobacteria bacterium]
MAGFRGARLALSAWRVNLPYDESVAARIRRALAPRTDIDERKMFGGLAFLMHGNMCCGVVKDTLVVRLGNDGAAAALAEPHARPMDFTGKPMKSMVYVGPEGIADDDDLNRWLGRAIGFAETLPPK